MLDHRIQENEAVSPVIRKEMDKALSDLRRKLPTSAESSYTVRCVSRDLYQVTIHVNIAGARIVATKDNHNIFTAMHEARKAVLRQLFDQKRFPKRSA